MRSEYLGLSMRWSVVCTCCVVSSAVAVLAVGPSPAQAASSVDAVQTNVAVNAPKRIVVHYAIGDFQTERVFIDGVEHAAIRLGKESPIARKGAPDLPNVCRSVIIPDDARMAARVVEAEYYDVHDIDVAPSKGILPRTVNPEDVPYTFGGAYDEDAYYPGELASLREPYILRDHRGVVVEVFPFQYNPVARTLRVYTSLTVEITAVGPGQVNVLDRGLRAGDASLAFHKIYTHHFLNYDTGSRYAPLDESGDLLIICYDAWLSNMQPLVDHKNAIGIGTTAVGVSTIGNNATSIKNYIQSVYNSGDLAFVLLVGDAAQVATPTAAGGSADPTYSLVSGTDHYPDVLIGRFSAESAAHVDTQVLRTIEYEQLPATTQAWFKKAVGIASAEGGSWGDDGETDIQHMNNIRADLLGYGYTVVDQIYDPGATASQVSNAVNAGRGLINYCGHGSKTAWGTTYFSTTNVNALTNDNLLPFIFDVACVNGQFDGGSACFAEAWMRATHGSEPTGAIGIYASSINQDWAPPMCAQDEAVDRLVGESYFSFGALCFAGSCKMMDEYGSSGRNMFDTWHVFGDPSVRVFGISEEPSGLRVTPSDDLVAAGPNGGPFTPGSVVYTLENLGSGGISYSVTKNEPWVTISNASGSLAGYATTTVTVSINAAANALPNGDYSDTVSFTNTTNHEGDTTRLVELAVGAPSVQYSWNMEANPGWSTEDQWAWGQPTGGGGEYGGPDPTSGHTGNTIYGYNLSGDYANFLPERHLTTTAIDCTGLSDVTLKFWRWLGVEQSAYDHAYIRISTDGSNWSTVWQNGAEVADSAWVQQEIDVSAFADDQPTVYLRWTMGTTDGGWRYCGWNIDDVQIWALAESTMPGPAEFINCMSGPVQGRSAECESCDFDGSGHVDLMDFRAYQQQSDN